MEEAITDPNIDPNVDPNSDPGAGGDPKTFTQEELNKILAKRLATEKAKFESEYKSKLESEKEEAAKLARMTSEQRQKAEFEKKVAEFESQQKEFKTAQLKMQTMTELGKEGLSSDFADFIMADDAEKTLSNLTAFKDVWQKALQAEVDKRLAGAPPRTGGNAASEITKEQFKAMPYKQQVGLHDSNLELYKKLKS